MAYATLEDLIERAGELEIKQIADRDRDGTPDPDVIDAAIKDASNIIDGYVGAKYALPLPSVPDLINTWTVSIARYYLHRNKPPDHVKGDHDDAIAALKDVGRGLAVLPVTPGETPPAEVTGSVMASHPPTVFTPQKLKGWR